jgi:adenylate cyclase
MRPVEASRSKHRPLNPDNIPFLDDTSQQELRRNYLPARESRALAITIHGHYGYATQRIDEEIARRDALATCDKSLHRWTPNPSPQQRCFIYAVGSEVVWTLRPPPMPPQPWLPSFPGQRERLDTHDMPFGADAARALSEYLSSPAHKAIVYGRGARIYLSASRSSGEVAVRAALQRCGFYSEYACLAVAVDDESITRTPKVMRAVDILIPGTLANVSVEDRERINTFYLVQADWRALAVGRNGRIGMATRQDSEQSALDLAMRECVQAAGLECAVAAVGGFVVARR